MQIAQWMHTALLVKDLAAADHFYGQILGLPTVDRSLKFPGSWYHVGPVQIHLIENPQTHVELLDDAKWGRNQHIALAVTDLNTAKDQLLQAGYPIQMSASGRAALFTRDPSGNVVELSQAEIL